ncbi:protein kinase C delta type-like [Xenopus laevis]|uniref:Protein kinase C delta type-like n=2 Tax=Xenopus laevis TaxID=8355 RepID=A0A1L8GL58_XENLA|nr:protein kinase C delta type-like [Xenopus laevis]OCT84575.1 hypothetical protein XELAEV_18022728mg [Xenopus laevis]
MAPGKSPFYNGHKKEKCSAVICDQPNIPDWLCAEMRHLLQKLLEKNPARRLGVNGNIREHPVFSSINWVELENKRIRPPFKLEIINKAFETLFSGVTFILEALNRNTKSGQQY